MISIPIQLNKQRFIKTNNDKVPIEKDWPGTGNHSYDDFKSASSTYGVLCGHNRLVVVDCDKQDIQDMLITIPEIRETFTVKTAIKKLYHFYFYVDIDYPKGFSINNRKGERVLDLQGARSQVIGPESTINGKGKYEIVNPRSIATISYAYLKDILINLDDDNKTIQEHTKKAIQIDIEYDEVCKAIKQKIKPKDLLKDNTGTNPTSCPLGHSSEGGKCFHHTNNVWHCFHCNKAGSVFQLYQKIHGCNFLTAKKELAKIAGIEDDIKIKVLQLYGDPKKKTLASEFLASEFMKLNRIYTIRSDKDPEMWIYRNGIYIADCRTYIKEYIRSILGRLYNIHFAQIVIEKIIADTYIDLVEFFKPEDINKVPVMNGILDIKNHTLEEFSPDYKFFYKLPITFDPLIQPSKIIQFFDDILVDEKDKLVLQELFGYLLYRDYRFEKALMFIGKGRNGKGKTLELMERFLGLANCANVTLQSLETNPFISSALFNKMANLAGDLPDKGLENTGRFKELTGHDFITADRKFQKPIEFRNFAKMIFSTNKLPKSYDTTDGFYDRWIIIDFPFKFVHEPTLEYHKQIDTEMIEKISTDKELSGLLNWALLGLKRLLTNNMFSVNTSTEQNKLKWQRTESSCKAFILDCIECVYEKGVYITIPDFEKEYFKYCNEHNIQPEQKKAITENISEVGGSYGVKLVKNVTKRVYHWLQFKQQ